MSIPTSMAVPTLHSKDLLMTWARRLQEYLRDALQTFAWPETTISLVNGDNHNIDLKGGYIVHVVGPTAPFNVTGIGGGSPGRQVILHDATLQGMALLEAWPGSATGNRITTFVGNINVLAGTLVWDKASATWLLISLRN